MTSRIVFRVDASLHMGTGHVMRCLTLADKLVSRGSECHFLCREHPGNLIDLIHRRGHFVHQLAVFPECDQNTSDLAHWEWLGATQEEDAAVCVPLVRSLHPAWLIVDHYAIDRRWQQELRPYCQNIFVIDDLADRAHECELLLDQTLGRNAGDYRHLVPAGSQLLCGSRYALLRPEFARLRSESLARRSIPRLHTLLIAMGGIDKDNATGKILGALQLAGLENDCEVTVVLGGNAPWIDTVSRQAECMPFTTKVLCDVSNMGQVMVASDVAFGAAGATSWERCCLGLPTIMLVLADNQRYIANALERAGAVWVVDIADIVQTVPSLVRSLFEKPTILTEVGTAAAKVVQGRGVEAVIKVLESLS